MKNCSEVISAAEMLRYCAIVLLKLMQQKYRMCDYYCTQQLQAAVTNAQMHLFFSLLLYFSLFQGLLLSFIFFFLYNLCTQIFIIV